MNKAVVTFRHRDSGRGWDVRLCPGGKPTSRAFRFAAGAMCLAMLLAGGFEARAEFTPLDPCRLLDTRDPGDGPALVGQTVRDVVVRGLCGIPQGATAITYNATIVNAPARGFLTLYPSGAMLPNVSSLNFAAAEVKGNAGVVKLGATAPSLSAYLATVPPGSSAHFVLDVTGYHADSYVFEGTNEDSTVNLSTAAGGPCTNYTSVSITVPGPGRVEVDATVQLRFESHTQGTADQISVYIGDSLTNCLNGSSSEGYYRSAWRIGGDVPTFSDPSITTLPVNRVVTINGAGTYTYYLNGRRLSGSGNGGFWYAGLRATFHPD